MADSNVPQQPTPSGHSDVGKVVAAGAADMVLFAAVCNPLGLAILMGAALVGTAALVGNAISEMK